MLSEGSRSDRPVSDLRPRPPPFSLFSQIPMRDGSPSEGFFFWTREVNLTGPATPPPSSFSLHHQVMPRALFFFPLMIRASLPGRSEGRPPLKGSFLCCRSRERERIFAQSRVGLRAGWTLFPLIGKRPPLLIGVGSFHLYKDPKAGSPFSSESLESRSSLFR